MYKCGLCNAELETLDEYLKHTQLCVKEQKIKEEDVQKMNEDLNRVKAAKEYFEKKLAEFKANYPEAYKMNFKEKTCDCNTCACEEEKQHQPVGDEYKVKGIASDNFIQALCEFFEV